MLNIKGQQRRKTINRFKHFNLDGKLADEKAYDLQLNSGDDAEDVNVWDFVSLADYVSIVTNGKNWSSFFEEMLVRPEETRIAGGKEAKTQWILRLSAIKNKLSKESYSVPVDEYSYVSRMFIHCSGFGVLRWV